MKTHELTLEEQQQELIDQYYDAYFANDKDTMKWLEIKLTFVDVETQYGETA